MTKDECPDRHLHTPCPIGYIQWLSWADKKSRTHAQICCPSCGLWSIWLPKAEARPINAAARKAEREIIRAVKKMYPTQESRYKKQMRTLRKGA